MTAPAAVHARHAVRGLLVGAAVAVAIIGGALALFTAVFGWARFQVDFIPLDNSRVGPNLCASIVLTVLVVGHNDYRTAMRAVEAGERAAQVAQDLEAEVLHPAERAERHIAEDIAEETADGAH